MENKKYWNSLEDLHNDPEYVAKQKKEFATDPIEEALQDNLSSNRRGFLKFFGFSVGAAATLAACTKTPVKYALPYVDKPAESMPTVPNYYASTFFDGQEYASVLVKTREGRPIKIEGNPLSTVTQGGVSARAQASVLGIYDNFRLKTVESNKGAGNSEDVADKEIMEALAGSKSIRLVTPTIISPSTKKLIGEFLAKYPGSQWVTYDAVSASGILAANERSFGKRALPTYRFDKADLILSFGADFLGTWISPTEFTKQYVANRRVENGSVKMSRLVVFESQMSLTGANADLRIPVKPSQEGALILKLYNEIATRAGKATFDGGADAAGNSVAAYAEQLWAAKGRSLVVSGSNDPNVQQLVNGINQMLDNYGKTLDIANHSNLRGGDDKAFAALVADMNAGNVDAVLLINVNPVYNYAGFAEALGKVKLKVSFNDSKDETGAACDYRLPSNHYLESWGDAEPNKGSYSLMQPSIEPLWKTRQYQTVLMKWAGIGGTFYDYIRDYWKANVFPMAANSEAFKAFLKSDMYSAGRAASFEDFWRFALSNGVFAVKAEAGTLAYKEVDGATASAVNGAYKGAADASLDLVLYQKIGIGDGSMASIPWLQEFPDPISKATWDNYACISAGYAKEKGLKNGDVVTVAAGKHSVTLPVLVQPGLQKNTIAIAVGYGRKEAGEAARNVGENAFPFASLVGDSMRYFVSGAQLTAKGDHVELAITQTHGTIMGRPIVYETTPANYEKDTKALQERRHHIQHHNTAFTMYDAHPMTGHHWAMVVDLNACTGCGACVISCQAENNIPVVGKDEIRKGRELHWIRIDRYYSTSLTEHAGVTVAEGNSPTKYEEESPEANPEVVFQPMMCQHCDNAPCENVCPVLATVHSSEGLNQQAYNRCFGTRYCANNCPYKVRRFNWLDYTNADNFKFNPVDDLRRMVLNPDVTVRARGTMEKCSFCVQRLQAGKLEAKKEGRKLLDSDVQTACSQSCPANAIYFGDMNDPESMVSKLMTSERGYLVLEEVKTLPGVTYLSKVRNQDQKELALKKEIRKA